MQADDQLAEWMIRWEEARAANLPPRALDQLPADLRPRGPAAAARLRQDAHGLTMTGPTRRGARIPLIAQS